MQSFEVIQKVLSIGDTYQVRNAGSDNALMTVRGKIIALTPKLTMVEGVDGHEIARMNGNYFKTKFTIYMADGKEAAVLSFPYFIILRKTFSLSAGGESYQAQGGVLGMNFSCVDASGNLAFTIRKQISLRDRFTVDVGDKVSKEIAILAAVAIDQRYFQRN